MSSSLQHKFSYIFAVTALCAFLFFSCKTARTKQEAVPVEKSAFYTILLTRDSVSGKTTIEIKNLTLVDLKIRYIADEAKTREPDHLKIELLYKGNQTVTAFSEHPLHKRVDLYSESGKIESKSISLSQGEVTLRVPYFEKFKKIIVTETINFKEQKPVIIKNEN